MGGEHSHPGYVTALEYLATINRIDAELAALRGTPPPPPDEEPQQPPPPPLGDVWLLTYPPSGDDHDRDRYPFQQARAHGIQLRPSPADVRRGVAQFLLTEEDGPLPGPGGHRAEFSMWGSDDPRRLFQNGSWTWTARRLIFPADWNQGRNSGFDDRIIDQNPDEGSPHISLHIKGGDRQVVELGVRRKVQTSASARPSWDYIGEAEVGTGVPVTVIRHVKFAQDGSGFLEWYVEGELIARREGLRTLQLRDSSYAKWGIYGQPTKYYEEGIAFAPGNGRSRVDELTALLRG